MWITQGQMFILALMKDQTCASGKVWELNLRLLD